MMLEQIKREILIRGAYLSIAARLLISDEKISEEDLVHELKDLERVYGVLYESDEENPLKIYEKLKYESEDA